MFTSQKVCCDKTMLLGPTKVVFGLITYFINDKRRSTAHNTQFISQQCLPIDEDDIQHYSEWGRCVEIDTIITIACSTK